MVGVFAAVKKYFFLCIMAKTNNGGNKMEKSEKKGEDGAKWDAAEWFLPIFNSPTRLLRHVILLSKKVFCCHNWLDFPWEVFPFNGSV